MVKRIFDVILSTVGLMILGPLLLWISWRIKVEDGGPVFYRGVRVGRDGRPFRIYKFRTMIVDAEKMGPSSTTLDDPRITKIGHWLRANKLDELPQLLNVLVGDMSFVGPRPEVKRFTDMYSDEEKNILTVRPGITDFASIWNSDEGALLAGASDPDQLYMERIRPEKIRLQLKYLRERSLFLDIKLILRTFTELLGKNTAAQKKGP